MFKRSVPFKVASGVFRNGITSTRSFFKFTMATRFEIPTFESFRLNYDKEKEEEHAAKSVRGAKAPRCAKPYNPEDEVPPDFPWYKLDKASADDQICGIANQLLGVMMNSRKEDEELNSLRKAATEAREVATMEPRDVAMVGQQGLGKSLLINALLDRPNLSKTSASGGACTASAIKYLHRPGTKDGEGIYDAAIQFMNDDDLREITEEHIRRYSFFHFSGNVDSNFHDEEERAAATAKEFLYHIFDAYNDTNAEERLTKLLTSHAIKSGTLLSESINETHQRFKQAGVDEKRVRTFHKLEIDKLMAKIEQYIAPHETLPSLWPIVQDVSIFIGSALTRNGICVVDLPGLGDLNQSRTAATNAIRRKAGFEIIVAKSERVTTEEIVHHQLKQSIRAHGAKNTILVLTKSDEFFMDDNAIDAVIRASQTHPFPMIKSYINENDTIIVTKEVEEANATDDVDAQALTDEIEARESYRIFLKTTAQCAFIQQRADAVEEKMRYKYSEDDPDPIRVFSVSSSFYLKWLSLRTKSRPTLTVERTGIPSLRRFLLGLSADDNFNNYQRHAFHKLPSLLDKATRIAHNDKKDNAYAIIRPGFKKLVAMLKAQYQKSFDDFLKNDIRPVWGEYQKTDRLEEISGVVVQWGSNVKWNTYNKTLRERGLFRNSKAMKYKDRAGVINWNDEIAQKTAKDMHAWRSKVMRAVTNLVKDLDKTTTCICNGVFGFISGSSLDDPLKAIAIDEWNKCRTRVFEKCSGLEQILKNKVKETWKFATTETDIRCMIAKINTPIYSDIEQGSHRDGWYSEQQELMLAAIKNPDENGKTILDKIATAVHENATQTLGFAWDVFLKELIEELELFDECIRERLPVDYQVELVDRHIRDLLKAVLPHLEKQVANLQVMIGDLESGQEEVPEHSRNQSVIEDGETRAEPQE